MKDPENLFPPDTVVTDGIDTWTVGGEKPATPMFENAPKARGFIPSDNPGRKARRRATALFDIPEEPGLRRKLLQQRQVKARGKLDVELRRLQRKALGK